MKKLLAILLAVCVMFGCTACGSQGEVIDETKTQVYVSHFNGGYGSEWITQMKQRFEAKYAGVSFEEGKSGVQVVISNHKTLGDALDFNTSDDYVFFLESNDYNTQALSAQPEIIDITDVVTGTFDINNVAGYENVPDIDDAEKNIISMFNETQVEALNLGTATEPAYYAVPWYEGFYGFSYDAKIFNEYNLFLDEDGVVGCKDTDTNLSKGPDNVSGTYDDGLPATYEEFFYLCEEMTNLGITPMVFSGAHQFYITNAINALITDNKGVAKERLSYDYNGSTEIIDKINEDGSFTTKTVEINNENGYLLFKQPAHYYGMQFLERLIRDNNGTYMYGNNFTDSYSQTQAQNNFLEANLRSDVADIAILAEGIWWVNEASTKFASLEQNYENASKQTKDVRFMPLPKATAAEGDEARKLTLLESQKSLMMIGSQVPEKYVPISKLFVQFCNTLENVQLFTTLTNTPRALTYSMGDKLDDLSPFGKSIMQMKEDENTEVVYQFSTNPLYAQNMTKFKKHETLAAFGYQYPSNALKEKGDKTAKDMFNDIASRWESNWVNNFGNYFN